MSAQLGYRQNSPALSAPSAGNRARRNSLGVLVLARDLPAMVLWSVALVQPPSADSATGDFCERLRSWVDAMPEIHSEILRLEGTSSRSSGG